MIGQIAQRRGMGAVARQIGPAAVQLRRDAFPGYERTAFGGFCVLNISFPPDIEEYIHQAVASGRYRDEQDVVLDALRFLRDSSSRYRQLRAQVKEALDSLDRGEGTEIENDEALAALFNALETEVGAELTAEKKTTG